MRMEEHQPFHEWLERHARGTLTDEATAALAEVVQAVSDIGGKGSVVLTVIVEPAGSGGRTVAIGGKVATKLPVPAPELGVFYVGDGGSLHRDDPYQQRFPGVSAKASVGAPRTVEEDTEIRTVGEDEAPRRAEEDDDDD
jgi:hypothetical protein